MDPNALAGMVFTLILVGMVGGFILVRPITRRLGALLEQRLNSQASSLSPADVRKLREAVESLRAELDQLSERQAFTEALLAERHQPLLPKKEPPPEPR